MKLEREVRSSGCRSLNILYHNIETVVEGYPKKYGCLRLDDFWNRAVRTHVVPGDSPDHERQNLER